ncbi:hypothetical protein [Paenibacillus radicis (ex Xue et al. 2023)]|uniref:Uncharacterized protein n=1 Tax=Paenibacillus radicis (ex Xue et al. 2023) TaxID=2972489 RepID=A0ABT1YTF9_9BACL|nr:hypothetical protein [Paenibacillus radicis (ex Xue et al. 2023)]MCR8636476.1 hypothetical protein [Paenibacillus radicis (ex Xue et al. 2023)]
MVHAFIIEPNTYNAFENEAAQLEQCKEWGLLSEKANKTKAFFYKRNGTSLPCTIIGFVDKITAVIEFDNEQRHCIHPSYLKEMQAANYGQKLAAAAEEALEPESLELEPTEEEALQPESLELEPPQEAAPPAEEAKIEEAKAEEKPEIEEPKAEEPPKGKAKKEKAPKLQLPEEKVKMIATVTEFTTVPNNFSDNEDEVIIYEAVSIIDPETQIGSAWSSHSATLKKLELEIGDTITFEGKIVAKKLTKHPVPYKINNPSKLQKEKA